MDAIPPELPTLTQTFGADQPAYVPIEAAVFIEEDADGKAVARRRVTAWVPGHNELAMLASTFLETIAGTSCGSRQQVMQALAEMFAAHPVYLQLLDFGSPLTPHRLSIGPEQWMLRARE
jgi:hypothetical protein